jgi:hypothetical protein
MHTQHVKFCAYVAWGSGVGGVVAVGVVFEEGEVLGMEEVDDDVDGSVLEVVVVVVVVAVVGGVVVAVVVAVAVGVVVAAVVSFVPSLSPTFALFESSSFFFLGTATMLSFLLRRRRRLLLIVCSLSCALLSNVSFGSHGCSNVSCGIDCMHAMDVLLFWVCHRSRNRAGWVLFFLLFDLIFEVLESHPRVLGVLL